MPETPAVKPITKPPYLYLGFLAAGIILHFLMPLAIFGRRELRNYRSNSRE